MFKDLDINQYLVFFIEEDEYAINVGNVREVLEFQTVSKIPKMSEFMRGVINLRGSVIPVIDLKMKFGLGETLKTVNTSVIVTEIEQEGETLVVGLLADAVNEVITLAEEDIEPTPKMGLQLGSFFIDGIGKKNDSFIIILNIEKILSTNEILDLKETPLEKEKSR